MESAKERAGKGILAATGQPAMVIWERKGGGWRGVSMVEEVRHPYFVQSTVIIARH